MPRQLANERAPGQAVGERRSQRSPYPSEALALQLQTAARRYRLPSLVLADGGGNLWASSCFREASRNLAALLRQRSVAERGQRRSRSADQGEQAITIRRLEIGAAILFLAAPGSERRTQQALEQAAPGVERILRALL